MVKTHRALRVYLAGPFFNDQEVQVITDLEKLLDHMSYDYFSPMTHGGKLTDLITSTTTPQEKSQILQSIFDQNIKEINNADLLIAVIDNRDMGTMIEVGYAMASNIPIISYSALNYGSNVMLSQYILGHTTSISELKLLLLGVLAYSNNNIKSRLKKSDKLKSYIIETCGNLIPQNIQ